jgi:hypothetical protein
MVLACPLTGFLRYVAAYKDAATKLLLPLRLSAYSIKCIIQVDTCREYIFPPYPSPITA